MKLISRFTLLALMAFAFGCREGVELSADQQIDPNSLNADQVSVEEVPVISFSPAQVMVDDSKDLIILIDDVDVTARLDYIRSEDTNILDFDAGISDNHLDAFASDTVSITFSYDGVEYSHDLVVIERPVTSDLAVVNYTNSDCTLTWTHFGDQVASYNIYRMQVGYDSDFVLLESNYFNTYAAYVSGGLSLSTTYQYQVTWVDSDGVESDVSNIASCTTLGR